MRGQLDGVSWTGSRGFRFASESQPGASLIVPGQRSERHQVKLAIGDIYLLGEGIWVVWIKTAPNQDKRRFRLRLVLDLKVLGCAMNLSTMD